MTAYSYDDANRMTTTTLPSGTGIVSTYTYDNADRLTNIAHVKGGSTTVASVAYTLDDVGNRTQRVDQQGTHTYAYDDLHRLTSVTYPGPSTTTYDFDAFGNRIEMVAGAASTTYAYDDADRLTTVTPPSPASPVSYTWDDNGNLTDRGSDEFEWDFEDRMIEATVNSVTTNFVYRGDGLRDSRAVSGGATTTFTWDIGSGLPVVLDDGNQYVYGAGLNAMKQGGNWFYYLADGLGSTMAVVDASGVSQKSYTYDVYGEATPSGGLSNEFDFAGQQTDATELQYLRARYYDPETGTFLSREPLAARPRNQLPGFGYASGNPISRVDPSGLMWTLEGPGGGSGYDGNGSLSGGGGGLSDPVAACIIWAAQGGISGGVVGGVGGAFLGAVVGCGAGAVSAQVDGWMAQCAVWGVATSVGVGLKGAALGCALGALGELGPDDPLAQCLVWAFLGILEPRKTNTVGGCLAGGASTQPEGDFTGESSCPPERLPFGAAQP